MNSWQQAHGRSAMTTSTVWQVDRGDLDNTKWTFVEGHCAVPTPTTNQIQANDIH